ncbi:unnamed protein product [Plutella xylostella]|uniref:(diamondback moth) hypothetical protein n=1 Tax=Plutella xylostella TaxID=51655 RepID=A0A8S4CZ07_PLUXY|nr:unnamed protein product [Plutella xylostella]
MNCLSSGGGGGGGGGWAFSAVPTFQVGDQVVSVNGYRVEDAVHAELAAYIATQARLKIKVRNVFMIPVKDKPHEALSWQFVSERAPSLSSGASSSPTLCDSERLPDLRLSILVPPRAKLGCGPDAGSNPVAVIIARVAELRGVVVAHAVRLGAAAGPAPVHTGAATGQAWMRALSWQFVSERAPSLSSGASSSPTLCDSERLPDLRLSILVPPRAKLGCGICKGPDWKPGIFVQFVRDGGLARGAGLRPGDQILACNGHDFTNVAFNEGPDWKPGIFVQFVRDGGLARGAGLRPGDQILACNGHDFTNVAFNEAIAAMKVPGRLELLIREGAGAELVSPESSGYNSSASSAAGERSPAPAAPAPLAVPAALRRRLASVAEEAADRADRLNLNRIKRRTWDSIDFDWKTPRDIHNFDAPSDIEPDYDCPSIPDNPHSYENQKKNIIAQKKEFTTSPSNRTIINLTEDGATIQCSYDNNPPPRKTTFSSLANKENEKKTIVVEVHHTNTTQCAVTTHCNKPPPLKKEMSADATSLTSNTTLSSAIAEEIQRRKLLKKTSTQENANPPEVKKKVSTAKPVENEKKKQHDALMDEFKKVHKKMFANVDHKCDKKTNDNTDDADSLRVKHAASERARSPGFDPCASIVTARVLVVAEREQFLILCLSVLT